MGNFRFENIQTAFIGSFQQLIAQLLVWLPKLIIALLIWWLGKNLINLAANWLKKVDLPGTDIDNRLLKKFNQVFVWLAKFILVLVILDYFGIGRTIISAVANGLTLTIALSLGIAFGQALKPEANKLVSQFKKQLKK